MLVYFHNISIVSGVWAPGVGSSWTIYETQWCAFAYRKGLGTYDALFLHVPVWVTHGALVAHWYTFSILFFRSSPYCRTFIFPSQCPCGMILLTLYSMLWDWQVSTAGQILFFGPERLYPFLSFTIFPFLFFLSIGWYCIVMVFGLIGCIYLSPSLAAMSS